MKQRRIRHILVGILGLFFMWSCTTDEKVEETEGTLYSTSFAISTKSSDPNAIDAEGMKTLSLYFVNEAGKVERLSRKTFTTPKEEELVEVSLTSGQKRVYGFSNLDETQISELTALKEGDTWPNITTKTYTIQNGKDISEVTSGTFTLPMSNQITIQVLKSPGQIFSMDLIRLLCKMRLTFENLTNNDVLLSSFTISPITSSSIYLLPSWNIPDAPSFPTPFVQNNFTRTYTSSTVRAKSTGANTWDDTPFYLNESAIQTGDPYGFFYIKLLTTENSVSKTREAILSRSYLSRNDYLLLPMNITDYILDLEIKAYPPIGGYPAEITHDKTTDTYTCTFDVGGPFVIIPKLKDNEGKQIATTAVSWGFTYQTGSSSSFFVKQPILKNGEITGEIAQGASGTAECTISVEVDAKPTSGGILRELNN